MNKSIEHIIEKEFKENSHNLDYVEGLKEYISNGPNNMLRRMAATVLNNISRYHLLEDTYDFMIEQIKIEKSKHEKSEFIRQLEGLKSTTNSVNYLLELTRKRETAPKRNAYRAMITLKHDSIEENVLKRIQLEKNNGVIQAAIQALTLNGTKNSIKPLIEVFKKSRDGSIRAHIVKVLEHIINRESLTEIEQKELNKFSKKSKLGFENIWKGTPKLISKKDILEEAKMQLSKNKLNLEFSIDSNFQAVLNIEKMKREYLRHISFSISNTLRPKFFKELKIDSFGTGTSINYTEYLDKTDVMKPVDYIEEIMNSISNHFIPYIFEVHHGLKKYLSWNFKQFASNYEELKTNLKIQHSGNELMHMISLSQYKKEEEDYSDYLKHCLKIWDKEIKRGSYRTREYLLNEMNTVGNNTGR